MTVTSAPRKPEGWYASKEKRAKYIHFFKNVEGCTKPLCGKRARQDHRSTYPLPPDSHYAVCPDCLYWYQNLHHAKEQKETLAKV